jgi:hypothetical protein
VNVQDDLFSQDDGGLFDQLTCVSGEVEPGLDYSLVEAFLRFRAGAFFCGFLCFESSNILATDCNR